MTRSNLQQRQDSNIQTFSINDLPDTTTVRWVAKRKAAVVKGVQQGLISLDEACRRYSLSEEEYSSWENAIAQNGMTALKVTQLKKFR